MMLNHIGKNDVADKITKSIFKTLTTKDSLTADLGGSATTKELTEALIRNL